VLFGLNEVAWQSRGLNDENMTGCTFYALMVIRSKSVKCVGCTRKGVIHTELLVHKPQQKRQFSYWWYSTQWVKPAAHMWKLEMNTKF
jgi:hypothetical protein